MTFRHTMGFLAHWPVEGPSKPIRPGLPVIPVCKIRNSDLNSNFSEVLISIIISLSL